MAKWKVEFSGFAYVEADNKEEAAEMYKDEDFVYQESAVTSVEQVGEFTVQM